MKQREGRSERREQPADGAPLLALAEGAVALGGRMVWEDLSLSLQPGELVAVLGPNGAGKSTLLRVILGFQPLQRGRLALFGRALGSRARGWREARERIGYLPQRRSFDERARIRGVDLVRLGVDGQRLGLPLPALAWPPLPAFQREARRRAKVAELLALVEAQPFARRPLGDLSGGEQQRLLIAQALASDPLLLLLDEPLNGLDLQSQSQICGLVGALCRGRGIAALLVAHDVNPLLPHLNRVLYLAGGQGAVGTVEEVIQSSRLTALYGVPIDVLRTADGRLVVLGGPEAPAHHPEYL